MALNVVDKAWIEHTITDSTSTRTVSFLATELSSEVLNREETVIFGVVVQADFSPINTAYIETQGKALILALSVNLGRWRATSDFAADKQLCQVKLRRMRECITAAIALIVVVVRVWRARKLTCHRPTDVEWLSGAAVVEKPRQLPFSLNTFIWVPSDDVQLPYKDEALTGCCGVVSFGCWSSAPISSPGW